MNQDKNIIKGNRHAEMRTVTEHSFYAVIEIKVKNVIDGSTRIKTVIESAFGSRIKVKKELENVARSLGGKVTYFGGFKK